MLIHGCNGKNTYHREKILLPLAKSNLIFSHSCNITLNASLPNFSFTHGARGIIDTNLLYKASLEKKKKIHEWLCSTFLSLPSESIQFHEDIAIFSNYDTIQNATALYDFCFIEALTFRLLSQSCCNTYFILECVPGGIWQ